jgi:ubiquinone/menaquinone biosynthesis C-methylase UbiE
MNVMGADISPHMLRVARQKLGKDVHLLLGDAEYLPFKENSFDCVALITTLEFIPDPERVVDEALRICRGKVLLGVKRWLQGMFRRSIFDRGRFYSIWELKRLVTKLAPEAIVEWASVLVLPMSWQHHFPRFERWLSFRENPLGAFLGMAVSDTEV